MCYLCSMSNKIDLTKYCTQAQYARDNGIKLGTLSQWVKRAKDGKSTPVNIEYLEVPELKLTLVKK
jgi:hypothetical protein